MKPNNLNFNALPAKTVLRLIKSAHITVIATFYILVKHPDKMNLKNWLTWVSLASREKMAIYQTLLCFHWLKKMEKHYHLVSFKQF